MATTRGSLQIKMDYIHTRIDKAMKTEIYINILDQEPRYYTSYNLAVNSSLESVRGSVSTIAKHDANFIEEARKVLDSALEGLFVRKYVVVDEGTV
jgi:hypothetical protein